MTDFKCPRRLARFLVSIGAKLNGEQLRECIEQSKQWDDGAPLNAWETMVAQWIMADDQMAEQYVQEHRAGLEKLGILQRQCQYALEKLTGTKYSRDYTIGSQLQGIINDAQRALEYIAELKKAAELQP